MNWKRALFAVLLLVPAVWALASGFGRDPHAVPSMLVNTPLPAFRAMDLDGHAVDANALRGKPALINFWATWCYPCQAEHALLQETARAHGDALTVLGVIYQDEAAAVRAYLARKPSTYLHVMDPQSTMAMDFGVAGVPETFFVDAQGVITHKHAGALTPAVLQAALAPLLKAPAHATP